MELLLDDEQSEELSNVMKKIEETCPDELQAIFQEGDSQAGARLMGVGQTQCKGKLF